MQYNLNDPFQLKPFPKPPANNGHQPLLIMGLISVIIAATCGLILWLDGQNHTVRLLVWLLGSISCVITCGLLIVWAYYKLIVHRAPPR